MYNTGAPCTWLPKPTEMNFRLLLTMQNFSPRFRPDMEEEDDFTIECTQEEVEELTERLLDNDDNNCAKFFR